MNQNQIRNFLYNILIVWFIYVFYPIWVDQTLPDIETRIIWEIVCAYCLIWVYMSKIDAVDSFSYKLLTTGLLLWYCYSTPRDAITDYDLSEKVTYIIVDVSMLLLLIHHFILDVVLNYNNKKKMILSAIPTINYYNRKVKNGRSKY